MSIFDEAADDAVSLAQRCFPILAGHDKMVQGAALVELVAMHLAGHVILGDTEKTKQLRVGIFEEFMKAVVDLIPVLDEDVIQPEIARRAQ